MGLLTEAAEDAATIAVPELTLPLRIWRAAAGGAGAALRWVLASPLHIAIAVILMLAGGNILQLHAFNVAQRMHETRFEQLRLIENARFAVWQKAFGTEQRAYGVLAHALVMQNHAIEVWHAQSVARQQASADAARAAEHDAHRLTTEAVRIERAAPPAVVGPECATPADVLAAEGDL